MRRVLGFVGRLLLVSILATAGNAIASLLGERRSK